MCSASTWRNTSSFVLGWVARRDLVVPNVAGRGDVPCRVIIVQSGGRRTYYLYVYKCGREYTPSFWKQQFTIFANSLLRRNASGALIRVSTPMGDDEEASSRRCERMLGAAIPFLDATLP
ncbi:MAG: exosortase-associated EpsI family protein [Planctomycetota bacterium]|nr:exosortase-associated EpsI family protein [Planctomycetota bacterium]